MLRALNIYSCFESDPSLRQNHEWQCNDDAWTTKGLCGSWKRKCEIL